MLWNVYSYMPVCGGETETDTMPLCGVCVHVCVVCVWCACVRVRAAVACVCYSGWVWLLAKDIPEKIQ